ncbi:MAG: SlyX family protein [Pseudomonadota bacterium]
MSEDRLTRLEEVIAHQAAQIEDLNQVVTAQADRVDRLERQVAQLRLRAAEAEAAQGDHVVLGDSPPPHY